MALLIDKETPHGAVAKYWNVGVVNYHPRTKTCSIVLDGYLSKGARTTGKEAIATREVQVPFDKVVDGSLKDVYKNLKELDDWKAGVDD